MEETDILEKLKKEFRENAERIGKAGWKGIGYFLIVLSLFGIEVVFLSAMKVLFQGNVIAGVGATLGSVGSLLTAIVLIYSKIKYIRSGTRQEYIALGFLVLDLIVFALDAALARELALQSDPTKLEGFFMFWYTGCTSIPVGIEVIGWVCVLISDPEKEEIDLRSDAEKKKSEMLLRHDLERYERGLKEEKARWEREKVKRDAESALEAAKDQAGIDMARVKQEAEIALEKKQHELDVQEIQSNIEIKSLELDNKKKLAAIEHTFARNKAESIAEFREEVYAQQMGNLLDYVPEFEAEIDTARREMLRTIVAEATGQHVSRIRRVVEAEKTPQVEEEKEGASSAANTTQPTNNSKEVDSENSPISFETEALGQINIVPMQTTEHGYPGRPRGRRTLRAASSAQGPSSSA